MLRRHLQLPILLAALVCIHSVCPLFCAAFGQIWCGSAPEKMQMEHIEIGSSCCQKTETTDASDTPSENETACCLNKLELVLPNATHNENIGRESLEQHLVSIVPFSAAFPVNQEILLHLPRPPKSSTSYLNCAISRRGPPYARS